MASRLGGDAAKQHTRRLAIEPVSCNVFKMLPARTVDGKSTETRQHRL